MKKLLIFALTLLCLPASEAVEADDERVAKNAARDGVYLTAPNGDLSYLLMGEFAGSMKTGSGDESAESRVGLQIRPISDVDFDAIWFDGGLPGEQVSVFESEQQQESDDAESNTDESVETRTIQSSDGKAVQLIGRRSDDRLILSGGSIAIFVDPDGCTLIDETGKTLGRLDRVKRRSRTLGALAPEGSVVLFDGTDTSNLSKATVTEDGLLAEGFTIKPMIQDFDLHVEFRLPYMPGFDDQRRSNSGIYIHSRYECQVLDSFAQTPKFNGLGSLYRFKAPDVNPAHPPLTWQTYDIRFTSPRYNSDGSKFSDAKVSSWVNGILVQDNVTLAAPTGAGKAEEPVQLPIHVQNHNDPVRFRNLWMIDRELMQVDFPIEGDGEVEEVAEAPVVADADTEEEAKPVEPEGEVAEKEGETATVEPENGDGDSEGESKN